MNPGKCMRMGSIFRPADGRSVIVAIDHGGIAGPLRGIVKPAPLMRSCVLGGADAVLTTRGFVKASIQEWAPSTAVILRLSGGFTVLGGRFEEEQISSPETALRYDAAAAAVTVKFGHPREGDFIRQASLVADACEQWNLPLMIEAVAGGRNLKPTDPEGVKLAARAAQEIGADMVKCCYTGDPESFRGVTEGCPAPVVILGGEKTEEPEQVFTEVYESLQAGGAGIAIGRNIWQNANPQAVVEAMVGLVHEGWTPKQALEHCR
ncbi:MAG: fructose-bisphosphate aldolase [Spirochaetales bacterium]|nr:fructose-bisphosphate aldolase [Spirochaetales bacterium]